MAQLKLNINAGNGIGFDGNKITVDFDTESGYIKKLSDGLCVTNLKGPTGAAGGSRVDDYTIQVGASGKLIANRDVVTFIWAMQTKTTINEVVADCNIGVERGIDATSYPMSVDDLFMFRDNYHQSPITYSDDGIRYAEDTLKALFIIKDISISGYRIDHLSIKCIWSSLPGWVVGTSYSV